MNIRNIDFYISNHLFSFNSINESKNLFVKENTRFSNNIIKLLKVQQKIISIFKNSLKFEVLSENKPKLNHVINTKVPVFPNSQKSKIIINKYINLFLKNIDIYNNWVTLLHSPDRVFTPYSSPSRGNIYIYPPKTK